jgi:fructosamine-3-kinase
MIPPAGVLAQVEERLEDATGAPVEIRTTTPVGGGCINPSARLEAEAGESFFLKWNPSSPPEMFRAEADGLKALGSAGSPLRVPEVLGHGGSGTGEAPGWLLMEFVPTGRAGPGYGRLLGEGLAHLHDAPVGSEALPAPGSYGWHRDNFIGSLPQANSPATSWTEFWQKERLAPQLEMARRGGHFSGSRGEVLERLMAELESVMEGADHDGPALLHGDLWTGNFYPDPQGEPVLIDPAVYRGSGEVDLAMMELFGTLPQGFREGYGGRRGLAAEYDGFRRDLYQLYYLLVHVNLFGSGYEGSAVAAAERALGA